MNYSREVIMEECNQKCEVYSRVVGYYRPVNNWNLGKMEEYRQRKTFKVNNNEHKEEEVSND